MKGGKEIRISNDSYFFVFIMSKKTLKSDEISNIQDLAAIAKLQTDTINKLDRDLRGTDYDNLDLVSKSVDRIVGNLNKAYGGDILTRLENTKKKNSQEIKNFKDIIKENSSISLFQNMLTTRDSRIAKYEDLMIITKIMPQLKDVKRMVVESILSPDDFKKQISLSFDINGKPLETADPNLYNDIKRISKQYKITNGIKHAIDRSITLGNYYYAILPYNKLYSDLINKKGIRKNNKGFSEAANPIKKLSESADITTDENLKTEVKEIMEAAKSIFESSNLNEAKNELKNKLESITIEESVSSLFNEELLEKTLTDKNNNIKFNTNIKNSKSTDGLLSYNKIDNDKEINLGIPGAKIKKLDPRRLIQLKIDDTVLQYYYIETQANYKALRNPGTFRLNSSLSNSQIENGVERIYKSIGDAIYKRLDNKFIKDNLDIKEKLYDVLHYADCINNNIKVIVLNPEEVVEFKIGEDGESIFEDSLFYAKLYMTLLLSTISAKISRSQDIRAYYYTTNPAGGIGATVNNAINTIKRNNSRAFYSCTSLSKMMSSFNMFDDLFIARTEDGNKPLEAQIIEGQQITVDDQLMEQLEKIAVDSTSVPLALSRVGSEDPEFSRAYTVMNIKFMKMVVNWQIDLNPSIEDYIKKILKTELPEDQQSKIESLNIYLQSPMNLLLNNISEQLSNSRDVAQALADLYYGTDIDEKDRKKYNDFMLEVCKKNSPNIPWDEYDEIKKSVEVRSTEVKDESSTEDNIDDTENY